MPSHIIFLHGASSSGKSTIARALQARIERPFWHISIDHLRDAGVLPMERFRNNDFRWADARATVFDGFHAALAACADAGNDLILEHILDTDGWQADLTRLLELHNVLFVAVHCPLDLLETREAARRDRPAGSTRKDFGTIHVGRRYDLELQTLDGVDHNVDRILAAWRSRKRNSDFSAP
ncbi:chloramphenicol phosphotransferase CPT family protein [Chachezhania sediminis]|uniref:chloramphenicol phosphotransferase CPT family protein n=1 Tax=Chachezhania sediminis TaxID=2599291 RepID=UPI00131C3F6E|nr:AAA family ATPase [Chachezhania sediminis]